MVKLKCFCIPTQVESTETFIFQFNLDKHLGQILFSVEISLFSLIFLFLLYCIESLSLCVFTYLSLPHFVSVCDILPYWQRQEQKYISHSVSFSAYFPHPTIPFVLSFYFPHLKRLALPSMLLSLFIICHSSFSLSVEMWCNKCAAEVRVHEDISSTRHLLERLVVSETTKPNLYWLMQDCKGGQV